MLTTAGMTLFTMRVPVLIVSCQGSKICATNKAACTWTGQITSRCHNCGPDASGCSKRARLHHLRGKRHLFWTVTSSLNTFLLFKQLQAALLNMDMILLDLHWSVGKKCGRSCPRTNCVITLFSRFWETKNYEQYFEWVHDRLLFCSSVFKVYLPCCGREKGIASNKLLAKIASAKNKPDRQTLVGPCYSIPLYIFNSGSVETTQFHLIRLCNLESAREQSLVYLHDILVWLWSVGVQIPPRSVPGLMKDLPLKKIKLLGGKLGEVFFFLLYLRHFHISSMDHVWTFVCQRWKTLSLHSCTLA